MSEKPKTVKKPRPSRKKKDAVSSLIRFIRDGMDIYGAGLCIGVPPETVDVWLLEDRVRLRVLKEVALFEHKQLQEAKKGGPRLSLEVLRATNARFMPKSKVIVQDELEKMLNRLEKSLPEKTYAEVLTIINKDK